METVPIEMAVTMPPTRYIEESEPQEPEQVSFGRYLSRAREARHLSLDDLAHLTKIRRAILEGLEHNARRELPEKVFVLGYVRSYAAAVGLNVEEAVQRCSAAWDDGTPEAELEQSDRKALSFAWIWPTLALLGAGAALWFIVHMQ